MSAPVKHNPKELKINARTTMENARVLKTQKDTLDPTHGRKEVLQGQIRKPGYVALRKFYKIPSQNTPDQVASQTTLGENIPTFLRTNNNGSTTMSCLTHPKNIESNPTIKGRQIQGALGPLTTRSTPVLSQQDTGNMVKSPHANYESLSSEACHLVNGRAPAAMCLFEICKIHGECTALSLLQPNKSGISLGNLFKENLLHTDSLFSFK